MLLLDELKRSSHARIPALSANYSVKWNAAIGRGIFVRIVAAATYLKR